MTNDALSTWLEGRGAVWEADRVTSFGDPDAEHAAIRAGAAVWVRLGWDLRRLTGADRVDFLHKYCTQEVRLPPGRTAYGCFLTVKGATLSDAWILLREDDALLLTPAAGAEKLYPHLRKYALLARVTIEDLSPTWVAVSVWGPQAEAALAPLLGDLPPALHHATRTWQGAEVVVSREDWVGVPGWDLLLARSEAPRLLDALAAAGAVPAGASAVERARVEAGVPLYGVDMGEDTIPIEAGLEARAVSYTKGCYLGQEVIARIAHRGRVNYHLRGLVLDQGEARAPSPLYAGEKQVGELTSLARTSGLGLVHRKHADPGTRLHVGASDGPVATVAEPPLGR